MKRGTESRVFLGKDTSIDEFTGINVLSTVLLGKKEGGFKDHNGLFIASNVTLGKGIARIITVVVYGTSPLSLPNAIEADVVSLKAFGGTENVPETYIDSVAAEGKCVQSNLPKEYIELESLTSVAQSGAYINTGIKAASTVKIEIVADRPTPPASGTSWYPFGALNDSTNGQIACFESTNSVPQQYIALTYGKVAYSEVKEETTGMAKSTLVLDGGVLTYDNGTKTLTSPQAGATFSTNNDIWLFGRENVSVSSLGAVTIYSAKLWNNGVMVRNLVCAKRKSDNKLGMFDTVTQTFIECQGSFVAGAEITLPEGYTRLDYIVFDSTQIIDTGFVPDNDSRIESKCYRTGADCWFYGASPTNPRVTLYHSSTGTCRWGNQSRASIGFVEDTDYVFVQDKNGITANNTLLSWNSGTEGDFTCDRSLTIGNCNGATGTRYFAGNLYYMKIYDNDVLVRNFVPCQNASNVVGLYDTVNSVFYTDTGLVAGPNAGPTPNNPIDIWCNNGVLKVNKNLVTGSLTQGIYNNGVLTPTTTTWVAYDTAIPVENGKTYTLNAKPSVSGKTIEQNVVKYLDGVYVGYTALDGVPYTFTPDSTYNQVKLQFAYQPRENITPSNITDVQLYQNGLIYVDGTPETITDNTGSVATCENLLQASTYTDTQSIIDGVVTRNVGIKVLDGTEGWQLATATDLVQFYTSSTQGVIANSVSLVSTIAPYGCTVTTRTQYDFGCYSGGSGNLCFQMKGSATLTTTTAWTQYLADQYAAGTPVMVIYPLVTATTESVAGQSLIKAPVTASGSLAGLTTTVVSSSHTTPTPSQPLDIRCNNGVLKATYNEFDASAVTNDYFYNADLEWVENSAVYTSDYMEVEKGKYTLVMSLPGTLTATVNVRVNLFNANKVIQSQIVIPITTDDPVLTQEVDIPSGISYVRISTNRTVLPISSFKSSNAVYVDGTQETIAINGDNLFDKTDYEEINAYVNANTGVLTQGSPGSTTQYCAVIPCKPNTIYKITGRGTSAWGAFTAKTIGTTATTYDKETGTITTGASDLYLIGLVRANNDAIDYRDTLSVNEIISTAVAEALLKVGTYADQQEIIVGTVTRKVGALVLDGTENWAKGSLTFYVDNVISNIKGTEDYTPYCTHYKGSPVSSVNPTQPDCIKLGYITSGTFTQRTSIYDSRINSLTLEQFKQWLADQYAGGTPVIVVYPLATETTESVTGQPMSCAEGDNTAVITQASMDGLALEVTYLAGATVTIQEVENAQLSEDVEVTIH